MSNTPQEVLNGVNTQLKQNITLLEPVSTREFISKKKYDSILEHVGHKKHVSESGMRISLAKEALLSEKFKTCVPIIIQDQLNGYAAMGHYSESLVGLGSNNEDIWGSLDQFANGSLVVKILYTPHSCNPSNIEHDLLQHRKDIISIEKIKLPDNKRNYFDVMYTPNDGKIFVSSRGYDDKVFTIDGLNRGISERVPQYEQLKGYFAQNIANTFFL